MKNFNRYRAYLDRVPIQIRTRISRLRRLGPLLCLLAMVADHCCGDERSLIQVDHRGLVSRADLIYESPVFASVEGVPIGNGRMGTTVWTTPSSVKFQINRGDVFATDKNHAGHMSGSIDYRGACAWLEIDLGGELLARGGPFQQRLSLYDAETTLQGQGVRVRCFISAVTDVLVVEVDDQRNQPQEMRVTVSMWRDPLVTTELTTYPTRDIHTGTHTARHDFSRRDNTVLLFQEFNEVRELRPEKYYCASAVAARVVGSAPAVESLGDKVRTFVIPAQQGTTALIVSSAATFSQETDVAAAATKLLDEQAGRSYETQRKAHTDWWHDLWARSFVHATSPDGVADFFERLRTLHLYYSATTSRGDVPPRCAGLIFQTRGDVMHPSCQYWIWGTQMGYFPLLAAGASDLTDSYFGMYASQLSACQIAAKQRWGAPSGAFYPETAPFNGPAELPSDVAEEYQDVFLGRKKATELSRRTLALCQYDSHLFYTTLFSEGKSMDAGDTRPFTDIGHCVSSGSEVAILAWRRYRYTGDLTFLESSAYPLLRETVEFYRHLVSKGEDGLYHIRRTNAHEDSFPLDDSIMDLAAMRGTVPLAIRAAEILDVDVDLRAQWQDLVDHLAPYPLGGDLKAKPIGVLSDDTWALGHLGKEPLIRTINKADICVTPIFPFEHWTLETRDPVMDQVAQRTIDLAPRRREVMRGDHPLNTTTYTPIAVARAGRGEELPAVLSAYCAALAPFLTNGPSLFEGGIQSMGVEHSGQLAMLMQEGLLQSVSPRPGEPEVISVFPAWPKAWEASFSLLARGGFMVTSAFRNQQVEFVEIESRLGETCRLRNPWGKACLIRTTGGPAIRADGPILSFATRRGGHYLVLPEGQPSPAPRRIAPEPASGPVSFSYNLPSGATLSETLGRPRDLESRGLQQREDQKANYEYTKWW